MSHTLDISYELPITDAELTTIRMETKEQRLQWRDFLSDSVSQARATSLFNSYDVESSPGQYARPPLSDSCSKTFSLHGAAMPHVVAPSGAGLAPQSVAKPLGANVFEMKQSLPVNSVKDMDPYPPGFSDGSRTNLCLKIEAV
jgi:hypothetical protein